MSTITDLIAGITQPQYFTDLMAKHVANGVPTSSWLSNENIGLALTEELSQLMAALRGSNLDPTQLVGVSYLAASMFLQFASGNGLAALSKSQYQNDKFPAQTMQGIVRLLSSPAAPTYVIAPGDLFVGPTDDPTLLYTNITGGTLPINGTLDLTFRALSSGSKYNLANTRQLVLKTGLAGVSVSNPIYPLAVTWITLAGNEEESDQSLIQRDLARWGTVGAECNASALSYWATLPPVGYTASPVKYVRVLPNFIKNNLVTGYWPGIVSIVLGNDLGALNPTDKTAVEGNFENPQKYGIGRQILYLDMTFVNVTIAGTVYIYKESGADPVVIQQQVEASLTDFQLFLQIGEIVTVQKIAARMEDGNKIAIREVKLTSPSATIDPGYTGKIRFVLGAISYLLV